jgi:hypothetical protein
MRRRLVLTMAMLLWGQAARTETLRVKTDVVAVQVFVDDKDAGQTPLTVDGLAPGKHTVTLVKPGYEDLRQDLTIVAGKPNSVFVVMKKRVGPLPALPVLYRAVHAHISGGCIGRLDITDEGLSFQDENGNDKFQMSWTSIWVVSRYLLGSGANYSKGFSSFSGPDWANPQDVPWVRVETSERSFTFFAVPAQAEANSAPSPAIMNAAFFDLVHGIWESKKASGK